MRAHSSRLVAPSSVLILVPVLALVIDAGACDHHTVVGQDLNPGQGGATAPCFPDSTLSLPLRTDEQVRSLAIGDWNGDGRGDMATVNETTGTVIVSVWLANGNGTFARTDFPTGAGTGALVQGDWNGDHALDLATPNYADKRVNLLLGRGDGTFEPASRQTTEAGPGALAAGDLNGDGRTDLVSVSTSGTISVWFGTRAGLGTRQDHPGLGLSPSFIVLGDFDDNGTLDLLAGSSILLGDGAGQFAAPQASGSVGRTAVAADFNHDGHLDLGVADSWGRGSGSVSVMAGTGSGTFSGATVLLQSTSYAMLAGDLDRDGYADLAAIANAQLHVWHGDEQGLPGTYKTYSPNASGMAIGDLNCDGTPDLATTRENSVSVLFADPDGF